MKDISGAVHTRMSAGGAFFVIEVENAEPEDTTSDKEGVH
jgi:hypothetical protein